MTSTRIFSATLVAIVLTANVVDVTKIEQKCVLSFRGAYTAKRFVVYHVINGLEKLSRQYRYR